MYKMDPTSFTKTSFCGKEVDNITENSSKEYILNQMSILCSGARYDGRYAKVYNVQYSNNLRNPHIVCLKSSGTPYLLFLTQINETDYCFLIDKKVKEGYSFPKIFILPYIFKKVLYRGSLFECELLRDRENVWSILIGDSYYCYGKNTSKNMVVMDRISQIHTVLSTEFIRTEFTETCEMLVKRYFDYHEITDIMDNFIPSLTYDIRGFYFVPLRCSYSKILWMFPRDNPTHKFTETLRPKKTIESTNDTEIFRIIRTLKPDVYELYRVNEDELEKVGVALVQKIDTSRMLEKLFRGRGPCEEVRVPCDYNPRFKKWEPKIK
jgi:hypothetical protein